MLHGELMPSARALALGNAFISRVNDNSAPFYNPAGLGSVRRFSFQLSNAYVETNKGLVNAVTGSSFNTFFEKLADGFDLDSIRESLAEESDGQFIFVMPLTRTLHFSILVWGIWPTNKLKLGQWNQLCLCGPT